MENKPCPDCGKDSIPIATLFGFKHYYYCESCKKEHVITDKVSSEFIWRANYGQDSESK